mgnify:CR=1 FL=1
MIIVSNPQTNHWKAAANALGANKYDLELTTKRYAKVAVYSTWEWDGKKKRNLTYWKYEKPHTNSKR